VRVLVQLDWNIKKTARHLNMTRQGVYDRMRRYKVRRPRPVDFAQRQAHGARGGHTRAKKLSRKERVRIARLGWRAMRRVTLASVAREIS
jgi:hypothetical protein